MNQNAKCVDNLLQSCQGIVPDRDIGKANEFNNRGENGGAVELLYKSIVENKIAIPGDVYECFRKSVQSIPEIDTSIIRTLLQDHVLIDLTGMDDDDSEAMYFDTSLLDRGLDYYLSHILTLGLKMISSRFAFALAMSLSWTTIFSMTNHYPIRSLRNFGILACYILGVVMIFKTNFKKAAFTWIMFGVIGGFLYMGYEFLAYLRMDDPGDKISVSIANLVYGPIVWPIMVPEAIEYTLAELGVLNQSDFITAPKLQQGQKQ